MTTIVNNPTPNTESGGGGGGFLIGIIVLVGFVAVILYFAIPALKNSEPVQLNVPAPQVTLPGDINVNVSQPD